MKMSISTMAAAALIAASSATVSVAQDGRDGDGQRVDPDRNTNYFYNEYSDAASDDRRTRWDDRDRYRDRDVSGQSYRSFDDRRTGDRNAWGDRDRARQYGNRDAGSSFYRSGDRQTDDRNRWDDRDQNRDLDSGSYFYRSFDDGDQRDWSDRRRADQPRRMTDRQGQTGSRAMLDREGSTVVGFDLDADGRSDVYYAVTRYELEMIRRRAADQQGQAQMDRRARNEAWASGQTAQTRDRDRQRDQQANQNWRQDMRQVSGEVLATREFRMEDADDDNLFARIRTDDGRNMVLNLGPASRAERLDLRRGDDIKALVTRGTHKDRVVPVAHRVRHDGRTVEIRHSRAEDLPRLQGRVTHLRTANLRNDKGSGEQMMVRLDTDNGARTVCLGHPRKLDRIDRGDRISVRAAPGSINGRPVYMAKRVKIDGRTIRVSDSDHSEDRDRRDRDENSDRDDRRDRDERDDR